MKDWLSQIPAEERANYNRAGFAGAAAMRQSPALGFDVPAGPLFQTPDETADLAVKEKVQVVGMPSVAAGHTMPAPQLVPR